MSKWISSFVFAIFFLSVAGACASKGEFAMLEEDFRKAQGKWFETWDVLEEKHQNESDERKMELIALELPPDPAVEFSTRFRAFAEKKVGTPEAMPALGWLIRNGQSGAVVTDDSALQPESSSTEWAIHRFLDHHAADPAIAEHLTGIRYAVWSVGKGPLVRLLETVVEKNQDRSAVAIAMFNLAAVLYENAETTLGDQPPPESEVAADKKRAKSMFRKLSQDFAEYPAGKRAEGYIFEMENLQVGMKAPEIVGTDVNKEPLRLSQFQGQVVVLSFWGFW